MSQMSGSELRQFMRGISGRAAEKLKPVLIEQADRLIAMQKADLRSQLAPPEDTGGLEQSIRREPGRHDLQVIVRAGGPSTTRGGYDRALAFEFGTAKQPARPFFYPSVRSLRKQMHYAIRNAAILAIDMKSTGETRI